MSTHRHPEPAVVVARRQPARGAAWHCRFHEIAIHRFPDGEMRVTVGPASAVTIIYASLDRPNDKLIALLFAAEALRRGGAKRLVLAGALSLLHAAGHRFP